MHEENPFGMNIYDSSEFLSPQYEQQEHPALTIVCKIFKSKCSLLGKQCHRWQQESGQPESENVMGTFSWKDEWIDLISECRK